MKNLKIVVLSLSVMFGLSGCYIDADDFNDYCPTVNSPIVTNELRLPDLIGFDLQIPSNVTLYQGNRQRIFVTGPQEAINALRYNVRRGVWNIELSDCIRASGNLQFEITLPEYQYIAVSGSGGIYSDDFLDGIELETRISGSGIVDLGVNYEQVLARIQGSGDLNLEGFAGVFDFRVDGSGNLSASNLVTDECFITINGSGDSSISVNDFLSVIVNGSGNVYFRGYPYIEQQINGSGRVIDAN